MNSNQNVRPEDERTSDRSGAVETGDTSGLFQELSRQSLQDLSVTFSLANRASRATGNSEVAAMLHANNMGIDFGQAHNDSGNASDKQADKQSSVNDGQARSPNQYDPKKAAELFRQLGDDSYATREKAQRIVERIGSPVLDPLKAAAESSDPEIARRAARAIDLIERREHGNESETRQLTGMRFDENGKLKAFTDENQKLKYKIDEFGRWTRTDRFDTESIFLDS